MAAVTNSVGYVAVDDRVCGIKKPSFLASPSRAIPIFEISGGPKLSGHERSVLSGRVITRLAQVGSGGQIFPEQFDLEELKKKVCKAGLRCSLAKILPDNHFGHVDTEFGFLPRAHHPYEKQTIDAIYTYSGRAAEESGEEEFLMKPAANTGLDRVVEEPGEE